MDWILILKDEDFRQKPSLYNLSSLKHNNNNKNNKSTHPLMQSIMIEQIITLKDKSKSLILSQNLASLQCKHGILNERRTNLNRPTENRHVKRKESRVNNNTGAKHKTVSNHTQL